MFTCANCGSVFSSKQRLQSHENSATACEKARKRAKYTTPTKQPSKQLVGKTASPQNSSAQRPASSHGQAGAVNRPTTQQDPVVTVTATVVANMQPNTQQSPNNDDAVATCTTTAAGSSQSDRSGIRGSSAAAVASRFSAKSVHVGRASAPSREPLPTESSHKTLCSTDGYYWANYGGSKSRGCIFECCRACRVSHVNNFNAAVSHIRNNLEMSCKCPVPGSCTCGKGIAAPLFVHSVCPAKRKRIFSGKQQCGCEEVRLHDASFCQMDLLGFAASINRQKVVQEASFAKNAADLKRRQVRRALGAVEQGGTPAYNLVSERMVDKIFRSARKEQSKSILSEYDSSSPVIKQLTDIAEFKSLCLHPCEDGGLLTEVLFSPAGSLELLRSSAGEVVAVDATFCCKKKWQLLVVWAAPSNAPSKQVPVFVALMNSKFETSYLSVFGAMRRCIPDWQPKGFTCDFELALRTQFAAVFGAEFQGCIWHFLKVRVVLLW